MRFRKALLARGLDAVTGQLRAEAGLQVRLAAMAYNLRRTSTVLQESPA